VLRYALEVATTSKDGGRDPLIFKIAAAQADAGLAQDASATVDLLRPRLGPDEVGAIVDRVKAIVARTEADAGNLEEAMSNASAISEPVLRGMTIGSIAIAEGKAGSIDNALKRVQSVQEDEVRAVAIRRAAWGLRFIATQRGEDGKIAQALRQSQSVDVQLFALVVRDLIPQLHYVWGFPEYSNVWLNMPALQIIVEALVRAGKVVEAMQVVREAEEFDRGRVFAAIVTYLAGAGRVSEALRLALELGDPLVLDNPFVLDNFALDRRRGIIVLASRKYADRITDHDQPEMRAGPQGKVDPDALAVARSFPAEGRAAALHMVAEVLARVGEPVRAAEAAQLIDDPRHRHGALIAVGLAQARAGFREAAQAAFGEAVQIGQSFGDDLPIPVLAGNNVRNAALANIATAYARAGMAAEALQIVSLLGPKGYSSVAENGDSPGEKIYNVDERSVSDLVEGLAEGGHIDEAIRSAGLLGHPYIQDLILVDAGAALSRTGNGAAALQVAGAIPGDPALRAIALAEFARALRRAGADGDAATAIRSSMSATAQESGGVSYLIPELISLSRGLPE